MKIRDHIAEGQIIGLLPALRKRYLPFLETIIRREIKVTGKAANVFKERPHQEFLLYKFIDDSDDDLVGILPTNSGKSLIYKAGSSYLGQHNKGKTIVVSPLISLMMDQVTGSDTDKEETQLQMMMSKEGVIVFNSSIRVKYQDYYRKALQSFSCGRFHLAYVAPERFRSRKFLHFYKKLHVTRFVIDEMHCVAIWGDSFRYEYKNLSNVLHHHRRARLVLLTASANDALLQSTLNRLRPTGKHPVVVVKKGVVRPEIVIKPPVKVKNDDQRPDALTNIIKKQLAGSKKAKCLVFTAFARESPNKKNWDAERLKDHFISKAMRIGLRPQQVDCYHAQMSVGRRSQVQDGFLKGKIRLLFATKAFGMGVNIKDIRLVAHVYPPVTVEEYYQEIGRGGRNADQSAPCIAQMLWCKDDERSLKMMIDVTWDYRLLQVYYMLSKGILLVADDDWKKSKKGMQLLLSLKSAGLLRKRRTVHKGRYKAEVYECVSRKAAKKIALTIASASIKPPKDVRRWSRWLLVYSSMDSDGRFTIPPRAETGLIRAGVEVNYMKTMLSLMEDHGWVEREESDSGGYAEYSLLDDNLGNKELAAFFERTAQLGEKKRESWANMMKLCSKKRNHWKLLSSLL
jgi:superfamily II DNA or RNA helicase